MCCGSSLSWLVSHSHSYSYSYSHLFVAVTLPFHIAAHRQSTLMLYKCFTVKKWHVEKNFPSYVNALLSLRSISYADDPPLVSEKLSDIQASTIGKRL